MGTVASLSSSSWSVAERASWLPLTNRYGTPRDLMPWNIPAAWASAALPKLTRSPESMTASMCSCWTIVRIRAYWLAPCTSETSRNRAAVGVLSAWGRYLSCSAAESASRFLRYGVVSWALVSTPARSSGVRWTAPSSPVVVKRSRRSGWYVSASTPKVATHEATHTAATTAAGRPAEAPVPPPGIRHEDEQGDAQRTERRSATPG